MLSVNLEINLSEDHLVKLEKFKSNRLIMAKKIQDEETIDTLGKASLEEIIGYFLTSKLW
ncbi:hypothetical protein [Psychrobacillus sp. BM2]|uniref:hypothetical protein n=1 Tax=Psychrobacillus sp. BM2 TaxID=3400421 RepID=UPI003B0236C5